MKNRGAEVKVPEIKTSNECNCSMCHKKGYSWVFPAEGNLTIVKGSIEGLAAYKFNSEDFTHRVGCALRTMARGSVEG